MWNKRLFDQLLDSGKTRAKRASKKTLPVSIAIHACVLGGVVILPLLASGDLPDPATPAIQAFFVEPAAAPPPPPPPPPPPAAARKAVTPPKTTEPRPVPQTPEFTAPVEVPKEVAPEEGSVLGMESGLVGGVPEGVEGGVEGGVQGGVVGGVEGGVLGGVPEVEATPPPTTEPPAPKGPVRVGGQIREPQKTRNVPPQYPSVAREARVQGVVVLEATISPSGEVTGVKVLKGIPLLNDAAVNAVREWRYSPTLLNGVPVPVIMTVTVNFRLDQ
ncbi:MAG TPA: energy transducer TonB [Vicinamibacteria bacterium]|jgi:protein TonB